MLDITNCPKPDEIFEDVRLILDKKGVENHLFQNDSSRLLFIGLRLKPPDLLRKAAFSPGDQALDFPLQV